MASIFIYDYNNYYNRKVKREVNLSDYNNLVYSESSTNLNFNSNDGVNTTYVAGKLNNKYSDDGNYLIYSNDNVSITSRWFIIESVRLRGGQYQLKLLRDTIADYYDSVINARSFIQKATLTDDNPLIYTQEPIATNQIKTKEQLLYDETGCAWIVVYLNRKYPAKATNFNLTINAPITADTTIQDWTFWQTYGQHIYGDYTERTLGTNITNKTPEVLNTINNYESLYYTWVPRSASILKQALEQDGLIVKDGDVYYRVQAKQLNESIYVPIEENKQGIYLKTYLDNTQGVHNRFGATYKVPKVTLALNRLETVQQYTIQLSATSDSELTIPETNRPHLTDAPYDMFCVPYNTNTLKITGAIEAYTIEPNKDVALALVQELALQMGKENVYDIQLLPYCPVSGWNVIDGIPTIDNGVRRMDMFYKKTGNTFVTAAFWCSSSHGTKNLFLSDMPKFTNKKISNQCDMYRLVSPNYNGQFEFNLAKNNTKNLPYFNLDYTYLPYNPYIHINPYFDGLYGQDYNDARGLICGGDYSVAYLSDAWTSYQINNKNYQNIFDRQIQNMETNHRYQTTENLISALTGSMQGAAGGAMAGGVAGPVGAAVGAAVGGVASIAGGVADLSLAESRYSESKSYARDLHNYQLDNIKALPYSIAKTTALNENNKIVPILETYTCTDFEKQCIANEIANNGMTAGFIDTISNYINNNWSYEGINDRGFIRAIPIEISVVGDSHVSNAISEELQKGVYFK